MHSAQGQDDHALRFVLPSNPSAVRETLAEARTVLIGRGVNESAFGTCELVLAEVLNNIVEHAYNDSGEGHIKVELTLNDQELAARIEDSGTAMPDEQLPTGALASLDVPVEDLPEGGFGWFMIRSITQELTYRRKDGVNFLDFTIPLSELG
ncbi:ATP-binding protein [Pacificoceanicola onchidii]|uniref:ATP-binding protein n=1 Tax=Pacificoceanicola onchidii TaxID=2562685 RepID=UPI001455FA0A|nr:ATP-binding protein [Pacificoceanicola onchidii]